MTDVKYVNGVEVEMTAEEIAERDSLAITETEYKSSYNRTKRNELLAETDWMANSDVTMTDAWKTYRQALRDLPAADGFPDVDMPTKPS